MELIEQIKALCEKNRKEEAYCNDIYGMSGGNYDDAYSIGCDYGASGMAKEILELINGKSIKEPSHGEE